MTTDLSHLSAEKIAFWSRGNSPTQKAFRISYTELALHFKALYMLADRVIAAASFFFESGLTRSVATEMSALLVQSDVLFFVNQEIEDFTEHGLKVTGQVVCEA